MSEQKREILIGYILGALEEDEIPRVEREMKQSNALRKEWAGLRNDLEPLHLVDAACDPPAGLAARVSKNIWALIDENSGKEAELLEDANCLKPIPDFLGDQLLESASPQKARSYNIEQRNFDHQRKLGKRKSWKLPDLIVSLAVGCFIAVLVFPALIHFKNRATDIISKNEIRKVEGNINLFPETIYAQDDTINGSFWKVGDPQFTHMNLDDRGMILVPPSNNPEFQLVSSGPNVFASSPKVISAENLENKFADLTGLNADSGGPIPGKPIFDFDVDGDDDDDFFSDLLRDPFYLGRSHMVFFIESGPKVSGGAPFLHSSGTQNVLLRDGHVFFRIIPSNALQPPISDDGSENQKFPFFFEQDPPL